jgi:aminotransferase
MDKAVSTDYFTFVSQEMQKKRDHLCDSIKMAGMNPIVPEGGYFVCADA